MAILIQPLGKVEAEFLRMLETRLPEIFNTGVKVLNPLPLHQKCYVAERGQYNSTCLLFSLKPVRITLGVTEADIFANLMNFVFGEAELGGARAIVSLYRLRDPVREKACERLLKEAVHEIGHVLGLKHCRNKRCVMTFSNSIVDVDGKSVYFCRSCEEVLRRVLR